MHTAKFDTFLHDQISLTNFSKTGHTLHQINFIKIGLIKIGIPTYEAKVTKIKLKKKMNSQHETLQLKLTTWRMKNKIRKINALEQGET